MEQGKLTGRGFDSNLLYMIIFGVILALLPLFLPRFYINLVNKMLIMGLFAMAVNLLIGLTGMVTFGHAAYFGAAAYTAALLVKWSGLSASATFFISLIGAPLVASLFGLLFGYFSVRASGLYFALLTLAFGQLLWAVVYKWYNFTLGDTGIGKVYPPEFLMSPTRYFYFTLIVVGICMYLLYRIDRSPFGWTLRAIRENPTRVEFVGIRVIRYRLLVFVLSTFFSGVAGFLFAFIERYVHPSYIGFVKAGEPVLAALVGGMYQFLGPVFGGALMVFLDWITNRLTEYWPLVFGTILVMAVLFFPTGVLGFLEERFKSKSKSGLKV